MAHLQCEGFKPDLSAQQAQQAQRAQQGGRGGRRPPPPRPADLQETLSFLQQLAAGALPAMSEAATAAHAAAAQRAHMRFGDDEQEGAASGQQQPQADLGVLLWGFFDRFGERRIHLLQGGRVCSGAGRRLFRPATCNIELLTKHSSHVSHLLDPHAYCSAARPAGNRFSYAKQAVSIRLGGVCTKLKAWRQARKPWLLAVEDPQEMGKDVGSGSFGVRGEWWYQGVGRPCDLPVPAGIGRPPFAHLIGRPACLPLACGS